MSDMSEKVAIVTGSNKGLGLATVAGLCREFGGDVYLTSRSIERGLAAVKELERKGLKPKFHQLDITDERSISKLKRFMQDNHRGLDVLVNNAGILLAEADTRSMGEQARTTLETNYFGTKNVCEAFFPILRPGARVVNVSSDDGHLTRITNKKNPQASKGLREQFAKSGSEFTMDELDDLMNKFIKAAENGKLGEEGWPVPNNGPFTHNGAVAYQVSKVGIGAMTRIQSRELRKKEDVVINHVNPGLNDTDMANNIGPNSKKYLENFKMMHVDVGAKSIVYLTKLPPQTDVNGKYYWHTCKEVDWISGPLPSDFYGYDSGTKEEDHP